MIYNPRFPHSVTITRTASATPFSSGSESTVLTTICRNYRNTKSKSEEGVVISDYIIAMPVRDVEIKVGDKVTVTDPVRVISGTVIDFVVTNFGSNIWWNRVNN